MSIALEPARHAVLHTLRRYLAPALCILLPLFFYLVIFQPIVVGTVLGGQSQGASPLKIFPSAIVNANCPVASDERDQAAPSTLSVEELSTLVTSNDLSGRYLFSIASALLRLMSIIAVAFAFLIIAHRTAPHKAILVICLALAVGIFVTLTYRPAPIDARDILVFPIMEAVVLAKAQSPFLSGVPKDVVDNIVRWDLRFGVISTGVVLAGFASIAKPAQPGELTARRLKERLFDLQRFTVVMAIIPILTVLITKSMIGWQMGFLCDSSRHALAPLGAAVGNYWGAISTGVILAALLPAYFAWREDVERFSSREMHEKSERERREFLSGEGLEFAPATSIPTLITVAAPAAAGPFLDLVSPVFFR